MDHVPGSGTTPDDLLSQPRHRAQLLCWCADMYLARKREARLAAQVSSHDGSEDEDVLGGLSPDRHSRDNEPSSPWARPGAAGAAACDASTAWSCLAYAAPGLALSGLCSPWPRPGAWSERLWQAVAPDRRDTWAVAQRSGSTSASGRDRRLPPACSALPGCSALQGTRLMQ